MSSKPLLLALLLAALVMTATASALPASGDVSLKELIATKNNLQLDGDVNGDGLIDIYDLKAIGENYGSSVFAGMKAGGARLYVDPVYTDEEPGVEFDVAINLDTLEKIFGASVRVSFDETILTATEVAEGNFLKSDGASTFNITNIDNDNGIVAYDSTRFGTGVGVSGDDALVVITFRGVANGASTVEVTQYELIDEDLVTIGGATLESGVIQIQSNRAPVINSYSPTDTTPDMDEDDDLAFSVTASDPDSDPLSYLWKLDGVQVSTSTGYTYSPGFSDSGTHTMIANVSDGKLSATRTWTVTVHDVQIMCTQNSDCGTDGYITANFCSGLNVVRTYRTYTCNDPGTPSASCTHSDENIVQQTCGYKCVSGSCVTNQPPVINSYTPLVDPTIYESQDQLFTVSASDPYGDPLSISWRLSGTPVGTGSSYTYHSDYDSAGVYTVLVNVSDGKLYVTRSWQLTVNNVNRAPVINSYSPTDTTPDMDEGDELLFSVTASDPDTDPLSYQWKLDNVPVSTATSYNYEPGFSDSGFHSVTVRVSDGNAYVDRTWNVNVHDVQIMCTQNSDCGTDGYLPGSFCSGLNVVRTYRTYTCNDPGTPSASCSHSDENIVQETCGFQCVNGACITNSDPVITPIPDKSVDEGQVLSFPITVTDPDGHTVTLTVKSGVGSITGNIYSYTPGWDSNHVSEQRTVVIRATDGHGGSDEDTFIITVNDINRAPVINSYSPTDTTPTMNEGDSLPFSVSASDGDGDMLSYTWKLDGATVSTISGYTYEPGFEDSGQHTVVVTVSDGIDTATRTWNVQVNDVGTMEFHQSLFTGFNTVQLPSRPVDTAIESVLSSIEGLYNSVLVWDGSQWLDYKPGRPDHYNTLHELDDSRPFHIDMKQSATLTVEVVAY